MNQAKINFGDVKHSRLRPAKNAFGYGVFTVSIPMRARRQNPQLLSNGGLGDNKLGLCSFFDKDHGLGGKDSLAWIENILQENNLLNKEGEIWLQTFPRVLGYVFNPVSFWICSEADGKVYAVLAEVTVIYYTKILESRFYRARPSPVKKYFMCHLFVQSVVNIGSGSCLLKIAIPSNTLLPVLNFTKMACPSSIPALAEKAACLANPRFI